MHAHMIAIVDPSFTNKEGDTVNTMHQRHVHHEDPEKRAEIIDKWACFNLGLTADHPGIIDTSSQQSKVVPSEIKTKFLKNHSCSARHSKIKTVFYII